MEALGTLVGTLLWPLVYQIGLKLASPWVGLPFVTSAGLFGVVFLTLTFNDYAATPPAPYHFIESI